MNNSVKSCPHCNEPIDINADKCVYCGEDLPRNEKATGSTSWNAFIGIWALILYFSFSQDFLANISITTQAFMIPVVYKLCLLSIIFCPPLKRFMRFSKMEKILFSIGAVFMNIWLYIGLLCFFTFVNNAKKE